MQKAELQQDSDRMRFRLSSLFFDLESHGIYVATRAQRELGIRLRATNYEHEWNRLFERGSLALHDILDMVTIACDCIMLSNYHSRREMLKAFIGSVSRVLREEQVSYRVDDEGGVHYAVDQEFEYGRIATITALNNARYNGVRSIFEEAFAALDGEVPDGKEAIRKGFFATESLFRLMFPKAHQLGTGELQPYLTPLVDKIYAGQKPAQSVAQKRVAAFKAWIEAAHFYRHEPGAEEQAQPPIEIAIHMLADAGAHMRWLAFLDAKQFEV
jgi:hypothetical protein